jgi:hypothetical protein
VEESEATEPREKKNKTSGRKKQTKNERGEAADGALLLPPF